MNKTSFFLFRRMTAIALLVAGMFLAHPASAQWWRFGSDDTEPVLADLLFNNVSAMRVERTLEMTEADLDNGRVLVRGRAEVGQGTIGRIEATLDGGTSWTEVPLNDKGLFAFAFQPEKGHTYAFSIRALSTIGKSSNEADHSFNFMLTTENGRELAKDAFNALIEAYMNRDRSSFMALVSDDFSGNITALDNAISDDFRFFSSIRITPTIRSVSAADGRANIYFSFTRQVRSNRTAQLLQDTAVSSVTLVKDGEGYKLYDLAAPVIFGVSDPANIASYVTDEAVGDQVLVVDADGNASTETQGQDVADDGASSSTVDDTTPSLNLDDAYSILSDSITNPFLAMAFAVASPGMSTEFFFGSEADAYEDLGIASISSIASMSANPAGDPTTVVEDPSTIVGRVYGLKLVDGTYALIRLANDNGGIGPWVFECRHQLNGTPNFN
ncbi:MAG TPA: hypothetical protein DCW68_06675 [Rhodospirillaceae bacterium]|nr:MAG: hypothetical protein A2018_01185 [Alphaproteobacteria bacterium GWF2_58_20]HAU29771.1 hypothetical protein [Rhodospirillaceae bacterium]